MVITQGCTLIGWKIINIKTVDDTSVLQTSVISQSANNLSHLLNVYDDDDDE